MRLIFLTQIDAHKAHRECILKKSQNLGFEIIGEAANRISEKTKKRFPHFPWKELVGMRNRLIHAYFDVDHDIIWKTIREYLPSFQKHLVQAIDSLESPE